MAQNRKTAGDAGAAIEPAIEEVRGETAPVVEDVRTDTGETLHVEGIGAAAVALGEAVAVGDGGPGVGAMRVAEVLDGPALPDVPVDHEAGLRTRRYLERGLGRDPGLGLAVAAVARRAGRDEILPLGRPTLDPASVPGRKLVMAAAQVRHDNRSYAPGETFTIDFRGHSELTLIGAIVAAPWHDLPDDND